MQVHSNLKTLFIYSLSVVSLLLTFTGTTAKTYQQCQQAKAIGAVDTLPTQIKASLDEMAVDFCLLQKSFDTQWFSIRVTGSARAPAEQARYIYQCLQRGDCSIYENQEAIAEYQAMDDVSIDLLEQRIIQQMDRNCYISKHLSNRAVDIGTRGMGDDDVARLVSVFRTHAYEVNGQHHTPSVIDQSHGTGPHLHINFLPYPFDPKKCPKLHTR